MPAKKLSEHRAQRFYKTEGAGTVLELVNDTGKHCDANYASVTAPELCYVEISIDDEVVDGVYVGPGSSHSWWTQAGGKLLDHNGLNPDQTLKVIADGPCAFRIDWM
jgi:hypothetical protein